MGLQRGNVDVQRGRAPAPELTAEQFRAAFTKDMRELLRAGLDALWRERAAADRARNHVDDEDARFCAFHEVEAGRTALQLLAGLHPPPYAF